MRAAERLPATQTPALEAGVFHSVEQIGLGADSISIVVHGHEQVLPFEHGPGPLVVEGDFDRVIDAAPGGVVATLPLRGIVRITLHANQLTLEDCHGVRLTWRLRFLGYRAAADVHHPRGEH